MKLSADDERQYAHELRSLPTVKDVEVVKETWYCVLTVIYDDGRVMVNTTDTKEDFFRPKQDDARPRHLHRLAHKGRDFGDVPGAREEAHNPQAQRRKITSSTRGGSGRPTKRCNNDTASFRFD